MELISQKEYVDYKGSICPNCRSHNISAGDRESDCDTIWVNVECSNCGAYWTEYYTLSGYDNLEIPKEK